MEDEIYETDSYDHATIKKFEKWFDDKIGTESELNDNGDGTWYLMFYDLTWEEVGMIRVHENNVVGVKNDIA